MCLDSSWASIQVPVSKGAHFVGFCSSSLDVFPPVEVLCQLYSSVLCHGDRLNGLAVEDVAGVDPVTFVGHSQSVTFLYVRGCYSPSFPQLQCSKVVL